MVRCDKCGQDLPEKVYVHGGWYCYPIVEEGVVILRFPFEGGADQDDLKRVLESLKLNE